MGQAEAQLFDLAHDLGEKNNLAAQHPEKVNQLLAMLAQIQKDGRRRPR